MIQEPSEFTPSASVDRHRQLSSELLKFKRASSFATQMKELYWREMVRVSRDITGLITRFGTAAFMNLLFALIFLGTGDGDNADVEDFNTHVGAIVLINISSMFGSAMPVMIQFPYERPVFLREYSSGTYSAVAYFLSRFFIEVPILFTQILMGYTIVYFSIQFQGEFIFLVLAGFGVAIVSNSLAVLLGCAVQDVQRVTELSPLIFVPQILFSGYFIRTEQIPNFLRWAQYLCGLKYGVAIAFIVEFDLNLSSCSEDLARENCKGIKESNDVDEWWFNVVMLIVLLFAFRTAAMMLLVLRAN